MATIDKAMERVLHWSRGGEAFDPPPANVAEALRRSGCDWDVVTVPVAVQAPSGAMIENTFKAVLRSDTEKVLGVVGARYEPLQNTTAFMFVDELTGSGSITHAWVRGAGREIGMVVRWEAPCELPFADDKIQPHVVFSNRHDGHGSARLLVTATQVNCLNQVPGLIRRGQAAQWRSAHSGLIGRRWEGVNGKAADMVRRLVDSYTSETVEKLRLLAERRVGDMEFDRVIRESWGEIGAAEKAIDEAASAVIEVRRSTATLADEMRPTGFGALHAITEHWDHLAEFRSEQAQFNSNQPGGRGDRCRRAAARRLLGMAS